MSTFKKGGATPKKIANRSKMNHQLIRETNKEEPLEKELLKTLVIPTN